MALPGARLATALGRLASERHEDQCEAPDFLNEMSYEHLAAEYYDPSHETCRLIEAVTKSAIGPIIDSFAAYHSVLDIGCGRGSGALLGTPPGTRWFSLDASRMMLRHQLSGSRIQADARRMPIRSMSFKRVIALLSDPYFTAELWSEIQRVLAPGGRAIVTLPHEDFELPLRTIKGTKPHHAMFRLRSGAKIFRTSHLATDDRIACLAENQDMSVSIRSVSAPQPLRRWPNSILRVAEFTGRPASAIPLLKVVYVSRGGR